MNIVRVYSVQINDKVKEAIAEVEEIFFCTIDQPPPPESVSTTILKTSNRITNTTKVGL